MSFSLKTHHWLNDDLKIFQFNINDIMYILTSIIYSTCQHIVEELNAVFFIVIFEIYAKLNENRVFPQWLGGFLISLQPSAWYVECMCTVRWGFRNTQHKVRLDAWKRKPTLVLRTR